ncbi:FAD-dependent monooxygenase [Mucilaginibacter sp. CAU 1740]|uniref:FAD-dependent monooxygenase n=1 Tax=Mucilaginibacter sp. CAU 1740 TaxID=3140365 RepID=UPI00325B5CBB
MTTTQNQNRYDVIIAGAGPVGLFLACELALAKCSVLILEKAESSNTQLKQLPFGVRGLSAPSIEALYRRGLLDELEIHKTLKNPHQHAKQGAQRQIGHFAGIPFTEGNVDMTKWEHRLESSPDVSLMTTMEEMETVLARRAESLGVDIKRGYAITDFQQADAGVTVQSGDSVFQSKWLVGCDGARSVVRKLGNFEFAGTEPEFTGYSTRVDIADPEKLKPGRNVTERGMYLQSQPGFVVIQDFDGGAFHASEQPITLQHVQEVLRRVSGTDVTLTALHIATTWTDRARQATDYRNGRVFLAGDAAHIHAPLGGQGLNLGLGDAMNLGWKLAATIHRSAPEGLLDTYYAERFPVGMKVLDWSRAQVAIMKPDAWSRALYSIISDVMNTHDGATYFAGRVWGIHTHYDLGSNQPWLGYSVPNFELEDGKTIGELMGDGKGLLIDFGSDDSLKALVAESGDHIRYLAGCAKNQLGLSSVLVRPDGIIAWTSQDNRDTNGLLRAIVRWF